MSDSTEYVKHTDEEHDELSVDIAYAIYIQQGGSLPLYKWLIQEEKEAQHAAERRAETLEAENAELKDEIRKLKAEIDSQ